MRAGFLEREMLERETPRNVRKPRKGPSRFAAKFWIGLYFDEQNVFTNIPTRARRGVCQNARRIAFAGFAPRFAFQTSRPKHPTRY